MEFVDFILAHEGDDTVRLLLSRGRFPEVDMDLAASTIEARRRLKAKLPEWYAVPSLHYPSRLSAEQCSSSATARYKARLVAGPVATPSSNNKASFRIADLTGGLGVDSWAFSQVAEEVLYNEREEKLVEAAKHNFMELGLTNVRISNAVIEKGKAGEVLGDFNPDLIYMDPARRAVDGRKVFLLEDCSPDVTGLLPELFEHSRFILFKLSPMADITMLEKRLPCIREIHIVATDGECRELLLLLEKDWNGPRKMFIAEDEAVMEIPRERMKYKAALKFGEYLFEPGKALLKSGAFDLPCSYGLEKMAPMTHLFLSGTRVEELDAFGKWFRVLEVLPLDKRTMKAVGEKYPEAEVSARNIPMNSDKLRSRLGCSSGGDVHIFGAGFAAHRLLFVCRRLA